MSGNLGWSPSLGMWVGASVKWPRSGIYQNTSFLLRKKLAGWVNFWFAPLESLHYLSSARSSPFTRAKFKDNQLLVDNELSLRPTEDSDKEHLWHLIFDDKKWKEFDAPYFQFPDQTLVEFSDGMFKQFFKSERTLLIDVAGNVVGSVSYHWEDIQTRWLEIGIAIYASSNWGRQIGRRSLKLWITHLFAQHDIERIGLTTWSGNPRMIASAESLGLKIEGRLRRVRYHEGHYYDSIKMGVLREEWQADKHQ